MKYGAFIPFPVALAFIAVCLMTDADVLYAPVVTGSNTEPVTVVLIPSHEAVFSAEVSATVTRIHKHFGRPFLKDDLLVELDHTTFQADLLASKAQLKAAQANHQQVLELLQQKTELRRAQAVLKAAQIDLQAVEKLYNSNNASQRDLEHAQRDLVVAQTQLEQIHAAQQVKLAEAENELAQAQQNVTHAQKLFDACTIKAPYPGRVVDVFVHEHEMIERSKPVIEIVDDRILIARFLLPAEEIDSVSTGRQLYIDINEIERKVNVNITSISAKMDPASRTFEVRGEVDNTDALLRAGMTATLSLKH